MIAREAADIDIDGTKQEGGRPGGNIAAASSSASASSWSRLKDPRIVRVSRAFGGKDRHSKVCTVRGLRDRRVRLSVPTAIQLYDLQDRLGLNQPSKVVDWLLNAAKHEIDELPPLQMPPNSSSSGNFTHPHNFQPLMLASNNNSQLLQTTTTTAAATATTTRGGLVMKIGNTSSGSSINWDDGDAILRNKAKQEESAAAARESNVDEEEAEEEAEEEEGGGGEADNNNRRQSHFEEININNHGAYINVSPSNNFFSSRHSPTPPPAGGLGLLNNSSAQPPYSSLIRWDPSTLSLAQSQPQPAEDFHNNFNVVSLGSGPHPHPHHHHQVLVYQPTAAGGIAAAHSSYFPSHITAATEYAPKQINFQMLMSSTNPPNNNSLSNSLTPANEGRPFHFTTNFLPTQKDCGK